MSDVTVTVAGFAGTTPKLFASESGNDFTSLRVAHTKRFVDRDGKWSDGRTTWFTVKAWRALAHNIAASIRKGDPVLVTGRLAVEEWTGPDGLRTNLVIEATSVGPDLSRGQSSFRHTVFRRSEAAASEPAVANAGAGGQLEPASSVDDDEFMVPADAHFGDLLRSEGDGLLAEDDELLEEDDELLEEDEVAAENHGEPVLVS